MFLVSGEVTEMSSQICLKKILYLKMLEICRIIDYSMNKMLAKENYICNL